MFSYSLIDIPFVKRKYVQIINGLWFVLFLFAKNLLKTDVRIDDKKRKLMTIENLQ